MAQAMEPGDRIVLYLTKVMRFAAAVRLTSEMFEDRTKIWPGKPGKATPIRGASRPSRSSCSPRTSGFPPRS